jgi:endonuclease/exonuclease/phosphatase family metal-dependent hydrolase
MRIGTYNVQAFRGYPSEAARRVLGRGNTLAAAAHFARALGNLGCEVLALQEGVTERQIARVSSALGMQLVTLPSPRFWPGHILSRYPVNDVRSYATINNRDRRSLEADRQPFSRMGGAARLVLPGDAALWVVAVHLHPQLNALREVETEIVAQNVRAHLAETPFVVVLGDFNCEPGEALHTRLAELGFVNALAAVGAGLQPTFDSTGQVAYAVDHIYTSPALSPALTCAEVIRAPGYWNEGPLPAGCWLYSDHLPVAAEIDL